MELAAKKLKELFSEEGMIRVITHLDTDGLTSAAIFFYILKKYNQNFWVSIVKQLEEPLLKELLQQAEKQKWKAIVFLDLGAGMLSKIKNFTTNVFIIDHHEIDCKIEPAEFFEETSGNLFFISPRFHNDEKMSASCLTYLFVKKLKSHWSREDKKLAQLAIIGLIGDMLDKNISKSVRGILSDAEESGMEIKKGLTVFSALRPIHKALEFSNIFIPGVTGSGNAVIAMLRDLGIEIKNSQGYRTLLDLSKDELSRLITAILLKAKDQNQNILDNIYLVKIANRLFDAREVSTMLNACGRLGYSSLALAFLIGSKKAASKIEEVYAKYKHLIVRALNWIHSNKKIETNSYVIINAKNAIKDTMIGTVVSILASSYLYESGTIIVGMAYRKDSKIKVSARIVKGPNNSVNLYKLLQSAVELTGGEVGGHKDAAGCLIPKEKEKEFLELLQEKLKLPEIKFSSN